MTKNQGNPDPSTNIVYLRPDILPAEQVFVTIPTSPATQLIDDILAAGSCERILLLPERRAQISHGVKIRIKGFRDALRVEYHRRESTCIVEFDDTGLLAHGHVQALKLFGYLRSKLICSAVSAGELIAEQLQFAVRDLIVAGLYKTPQSARVGLKIGMEVLLSMKVSPSAEKAAVPTSLFSDYHIKNGKVQVLLNQDLNWQALFAHFPSVPAYVFSLAPHAYSLLLYICELANQRSNQIGSNGSFSIQLKSLQSKLGLPEPDSHAFRNIIGTIEKAISEIKTSQGKNFFSANSLFQFSFTPERPSSIRDLDDTRLTVTAGEHLLSLLNKRRKNRRGKDQEQSMKKRIQTSVG